MKNLNDIENTPIDNLEQSEQSFSEYDAASYSADTPADAWYHYTDEDYEDEGYEGDYEYDYEYDDYGDTYYDEEIPPEVPEKKKRKGLKIFANVLLGICTFLAAFYLTVLYCPAQPIRNLRNMYIQAAMSTLSHKWLATSIIPGEMIDEVVRAQYESEAALVGVNSNWGTIDVQAVPTFANDTITSEEAAAAQQAAEAARLEGEASAANETPVDSGLLEGDDSLGPEFESSEQATFFSMFYELDYDSMMDYVDAHPEVLNNGWSGIDINEAGLDDNGTDIYTTEGEQVLAINAEEGIIIFRVYCNNSRGLMAVLKDTSRLSLKPASTLGVIGQTAGNICEANNGILAINGSAFMDDGSGNGGQIAGLAVCDGKFYGSKLYSNYKRIELRKDGKMYVVDSSALIYDDTLQACEFKPALIVDGEITVDENCGWTAPAPRTVIGQSSRLETMMVVIEGRFLDSPGCSVVDIAELMHKHGCVQAMNLDGGTSSMMYYDGEYLNRCSNTALSGGRPLPTAWVYTKAS